MNVNIIYVGNVKEAYYKEAIAEYEKRISAYAKVNDIEIKEEKSSIVPTDSEIDIILKKEGERIVPKLTGKAYKIALCVEGKQMSSEEFGDLFAQKTGGGINDFTFVIGGSYGLCESVKQMCDYRMSFSKMTLPHRLMRLVLCEQIYRANSIINGGKYHK